MDKNKKIKDYNHYGPHFPCGEDSLKDAFPYGINIRPKLTPLLPTVVPIHEIMYIICPSCQREIPISKEGIKNYPPRYPPRSFTCTCGQKMVIDYSQEGKDIKNKMINILSSHPEGMSLRAISRSMGFSVGKTNRIINEMIEEKTAYKDEKNLIKSFT